VPRVARYPEFGNHVKILTSKTHRLPTEKMLSKLKGGVIFKTRKLQDIRRFKERSPQPLTILKKNHTDPSAVTRNKMFSQNTAGIQ
jgi:hypothetical protein